MNLKFTYRFAAMALVLAFFAASCTQEEDSDVEGINSQKMSQTYSEPIPGQYIVVYREKGNPTKDYQKGQELAIEMTKRVLSANNLASAEVLQVYSSSLQGAAMKLTVAEVLKLRNSKEVAYVEQDRIVALAPPCGTPNGGPCDPGDGDGGGDDGDGGSSQETPYGILRVNGVSSYSGTNVAWVLDTGIDLDHPDLNVDVSRGFNAFTSGRDGKSLDDGNGHGTHVAGTIAAINNSFGVIGVAPGATVIPVKVLDSRGSGSYSGIIAGVDYIAAQGSSGDVANLSLGGPASDALDEAVKRAAGKGIKFALAAGNESQNANNVSPARVNGANIYTISAVDSDDNWAYFSNYANPPVDYAAPGVSVKSTYKNGGYNSISGTSMASPHAAGVLLLGNPSTNGTAKGDPDGNADPIIVH